MLHETVISLQKWKQEFRQLSFIGKLISYGNWKFERQIGTRENYKKDWYSVSDISLFVVKWDYHFFLIDAVQEKQEIYPYNSS